MARRGIKKITARVVPSKNVARNKENPYSGMDPQKREEILIRNLGRAWASACRRQAERRTEGTQPPCDDDS